MGQYAWIGYGYVANQSGGFQGIWLGPENDWFDILGVNCALYFQVESVSKNGVRTFPIRLKLEPKAPAKLPIPLKEIRNAVLYDENGKYRPGDFGFQKPSRLGSGATMTIAEYAMNASSLETSEQLRAALAAAYKEYSRFLNSLKCL